MSTRIITQLIDDLDGTSEATETVEFAVAGTTYEMDLTDEHAAEFEAAVAPYLEVARKTIGRPRFVTSAPRRGGHGAEPSEVKRWAKANGFTVAHRGRISKEILDAYASRDTQAKVPAAAFSE